MASGGPHPDDALRRAGSAAVRFNAPIGPDRVDQISTFLTSVDASTVIDLGCGRGELLLHCATRSKGLQGTGVDTAADLLQMARKAADEQDLSDRVDFVRADAATWTGQADTAFCVGVSHVFDGPRRTMARLRDLGVTTAVVGQAVWEHEPAEDLYEAFGPQPAGVADLAAHANALGWSVVETASSTPAEWDSFEDDWTRGVRAVDTVEATRFADERAALSRRYRGVLGFGWLFMRAAGSRH